RQSLPLKILAAAAPTGPATGLPLPAGAALRSGRRSAGLRGTAGGVLPRRAGARLMPGTKALVLIPSYDSGPKLLETVREARAQWPDVWVVVDGSTDGSDAPVREAAARDPGLRVLALPRN